MSKLMPHERLLWRGKPAWRGVARDVLHIRLVAGYFAVMLIWGFASDRSDGWGPLFTLWRGVPLFTLGSVVLAACAGYAWVIARTTRYTVTSERIIMDYGVAIEATVSVPLNRIASIGIVARRDGTGDVLLTPKLRGPLRYIKLWPHARPWRLTQVEPMLRCVPQAMDVAGIVSQAALDAVPGIIHAVPGGQGQGQSQPGSGMPDPIWAPSGARAAGAD